MSSRGGFGVDSPWAWGRRDAAARVHWLARRRRGLAFCIGRTKRRTGRRTMRMIGLVLLSIAIMALLLTDADAKRRSSAQASQAGGGQQKLVRDLSRARPQRQLQLFVVRSMLGDGAGPRRLLPTQSVSGHVFRDRLHLGFRSDALELRRVRRRPLTARSGG